MGEKEKIGNTDMPAASSAAVRILDAAINRATEGLRVVEDFARMVLEDKFLSSRLKQLRHDLAESSKCIDARMRLASRDSESDVGRHTKTQSEYQREDFESIIRANMTRVQQATRTIEEFSKSRYPSLTQIAEQVRYQAYTIEKSVFTTAFNRDRFQKARLYVLVDACGETSGFDKLGSLVKCLVSANVDLIQLRDKSLSDGELIEAGKLIRDLTCASETLFVMNDRADLCVAAGADGVHLGQDDMSVHDARMILKPNQFIGVSTHSIEQARQAVIDGADYIGVGPVFPSTTKNFDSHVGVELVAQVTEDVSLPAFAIGGVDAANVKQVIEAGCRRVAVSSAVCAAADPASSAKEIREMLTDRESERFRPEDA